MSDVKGYLGIGGRDLESGRFPTAQMFGLGLRLGPLEERARRESSSIQALAGTNGCQRRSSRSKALVSTTSLRMTAVIATWCGLPQSTSRW